MTNETLQSKNYYELRIGFVVRQYAAGKLTLEEISENRGKLIKLLSESVDAFENIKDNLNYQILDDLINNKLGIKAN